MTRRHEVVCRVLALLPGELDPEQVERSWFCDVRRNGGWRLTDQGLAAFDSAGIQRWRVPLGETSLDRRLILEMNRRIRWPYYLSVRPYEIWLFSDQDAVMAQLYGDIRAWVTNLEHPRPTDKVS
jgi:hypothetical protein